MISKKKYEKFKKIIMKDLLIYTKKILLDDKLIDQITIPATFKKYLEQSNYKYELSRLTSRDVSYFTYSDLYKNRLLPEIIFEINKYTPVVAYKDKEKEEIIIKRRENNDI